MNDLAIQSPVVEQATSTGLVIKDGATVEQLIDVLHQIGDAHEQAEAFVKSVVNWGRGDVWNKLEHANGADIDFDRAELAKKEGLNYTTVSSYARTCRTFDFSDRSLKLGITHHLALANKPSLSKQQRMELLERAVEGETNKKGEHKVWSVARLKKEARALIGDGEGETRGRPAGGEAGLPLIEEAIAETIADIGEVPKKVKPKVTKAVKKVFGELKKSFQAEVKAEVDLKIKEQRETLSAYEKKAKKKLDSAIKIQAGAKAFMTHDEFRFIRSLLHPDRAPAGFEEKFTKAAEIMNRVGERAGW